MFGKKTIFLLCAINSVLFTIIAEETPTSQAQQAPKPEQKAAPDNNYTLERIATIMDAFILATCASHEQCNYIKGYATCLIDLKINELKMINASYTNATLCHLYVWFERSEKIIKDALANQQKKIKLPTIELATHEAEIDVDEYIKRAHSKEDEAKKQAVNATLFFPFK